MKRTLRYYKIRLLKYLLRVGIAISVLINVILGGPSNQTFSARNYGWKLEKKLNLVWLIDSIFFFDKNHSLYSWVYWKAGKNLRKKQYYKQISEDYIRKDALFYHAQE